MIADDGDKNVSLVCAVQFNSCAKCKSHGKVTRIISTGDVATTTQRYMALLLPAEL